MNENLYMNANGHRLVAEYEGPPRLTARLCEGGAWELGKGITFNLNGEPFKEGDTCTPEYADALYRHALEGFEAGVREAVTVPLTSDEFSALVAFAYNVGLENFRTSSVLRRVNENRMDDAAACFGMWIFATKDGHKQALRGLLRRRYAEACLFMSYSWTEACDNDAIALQREIPETFPGTDRVIYKTPFKDVLAVAQRYPLAPASELVLTPSMQAAPPPFTAGSKEAVGAGPTPQPSPASAPVSPQVSPAPSASVVPPASVTRKPEVVIAPPAQPPRAPVPAPAPKPASPPVVAGQDGAKPKSPWTVQPEDVHYKIDPGAGLKPLEDSDRAKAFYWQRTFMFIIYIGGTGVFGSSMLAGSELLMKHAALMSVVLDLAVPAAMALSAIVLGAVGKSWADWRRHCAQEKASQGLY